MIDFPLAELMDESISALWSERCLHVDGLECRRCGGTERRVFRKHIHFQAYRCQACDVYYMLLSGLVFVKLPQQPVTPVRLRYVMVQRKPTTRFAHELRLSRKQLHTLRQHL